MRRPARVTIATLMFAFVLSACGPALGAPVVFWASDPVGPDDTVLVSGDGLETTDSIRIERLADNPDAAAVAVQTAVVRPQEVSSNSLKFVLPSDFREGVYRFTVGRDHATTLMLNAASVYWIQGELGTASAAGGWIRIFGRNVGRTAEARLVLTAADGHAINIKPALESSWDVSFPLPVNIQEGSYRARLWNGNGDATTWRDLGFWEVRGKPTLPSLVLSVKDFGARGDGAHDDTLPIRAALRTLSERGGGTLLFPRGYYKLSEGLTLPPHARLKGEDRSLVRLIWTDTWSPPFALLEGTSDFEIEDVTIFAGNHGHVISGGFVQRAAEALDGAKNISIRRVIVRASMYRGHLTPEEVAKRSLAALNYSTGGPDTVRLAGQNLVIEDCDLYASGRSFYLYRPRGARLSRNKLYNGRWGWYSISGANGVIFEGNKLVGSDLQSAGGGINTLGKIPQISENVAFIRNRFEMISGWDREELTSDGPGGCYYGKVAAITPDGLEITLPEPNPGDASELSQCVSAGVYILDGRGLGQVRQIRSVSGRTLRLDRSFLVPPDNNSTIAVTNLQRHYLIVGNEFFDASVAVQFYGASVEHVVADNVSVRTGGFISRGLYYRQFQPSWYTQFLRNHIIEGEATRESIIGVWGSQRTPNSAPLSFATIVRGNRLDGNSHIEVKGVSKQAPGVRDVIVEKNIISNSNAGVTIDQGVTGTIVRDNEFYQVRLPVNDMSADKHSQ